MIEQFAPAGAVASTVVAAWYLWKIQAIAQWARTLALVLALMAGLAVVGALDLARLVELARAIPLGDVLVIEDALTGVYGRWR